MNDLSTHAAPVVLQSSIAALREETLITGKILATKTCSCVCALGKMSGMAWSGRDFRTPLLDLGRFGPTSALPSSDGGGMFDGYAVGGDGSLLVARLRAYPPSQPAKHVCEIVFDLQHGRCELPIFGFTRDREASYAVLYQWVLRQGCFSSITFDLSDSLESGRPVVVVGPGTAMSPGDSAALDRHQRGGGRLLVLTSPEDDVSVVNALTRPWGVRIADQPCRGSEIVEIHSGSRVCTFRRASIIDGGTPLLRAELGDPAATYVPLGQGDVIVVGLGDQSRDAQMGGWPHVIPDEDLLAAFELGFALLRDLASGNVVENIQALGLRSGRHGIAPTT